MTTRRLIMILKLNDLTRYARRALRSPPYLCAELNGLDVNGIRRSLDVSLATTHGQVSLILHTSTGIAPLTTLPSVALVSRFHHRGQGSFVCGMAGRQAANRRAFEAGGSVMGSCLFFPARLAIIPVLLYVSRSLRRFWKRSVPLTHRIFPS
jgi:hypothetical protein